MGERAPGKLTLRKVGKLAGVSVLLGLLLLTGYYGVAIARARRATPALVADVLARASVRASDLTPWQRRALLAVEDPGFFAHDGIDLSTPGGGLTTITQAVAKKLYFHPFEPGLRKLELMLLARWVVHPLVSKEDQISLFVNLIYLGRHEGRAVVGFGDAAGAYFGKSVHDLSEDEYLALVAMPIAPTTFHLRDHAEANAERVRRIRLLLDGKYRPRGLMDQYYGPLDEETRQRGLPPASYFPPSAP
ncbi:MAG: transglycosylase domain-containing protein [Myxococcota bacterium]|jgi:membrane peptidoglycan carboxypeptidase|nr:transglycosylase domain-containing protein [Myxococcota bacterium]